MKQLSLIVTAVLVLFLSTSLFAQVENTVKKAKVKIETETKKACSAECSKECCSSKGKEIKASMSKKHGTDCKCEGCTTASAGIQKGEKMMQKAHSADCDCEGCKMAKAELKKHKAHAKNCSCEGCAKA